MWAASPDLYHGESGFQEAADMFPNLSVGLGRLPEVVPHFLVGFVHHPPLLHGHTPRRTPTGKSQHGLPPTTSENQMMFTENKETAKTLTRPDRRDIRTPVRWETRRLGTTHRWEQTEDPFELWLKSLPKNKQINKKQCMTLS